jgi:PAS domain S-box-containing protein
MFPFIALADEVLRTAVNVVKRGGHAQRLALDTFPAAIYVTDLDGFISYFNPVCVGFAGRTPTIGLDRWCVTWKLYTDEGDFLPHDQCPMAIAIRTKHVVRGATAVAERPNGTRINFMPFPTPVVGDHGEMLGGVNMLIDITSRHERELRKLYEDLLIWQTVIIAQTLTTFSIDDVRKLLREIEQELKRRTRRTLH